jgi:hypothetical protein
MPASFAPTVLALAGAAFDGQAPLHPLKLGSPSRERDGRLECCIATCGDSGVLKIWVTAWDGVDSTILRVQAVAFARSRKALVDGSCDLPGGPSPVLCAAAAAGSRRWVRRSWVRLSEGRSSRREVFISGTSLGFSIRAGCWLLAGERADHDERLKLFEVVGLGARRVSDAPAGLAVLPAGRAAWLSGDDGRMTMRRPVLLVLSSGVRPRLMPHDELRSIAAAQRYASATYRYQR